MNFNSIIKARNILQLALIKVMNHHARMLFRSAFLWSERILCYCSRWTAHHSLIPFLIHLSNLHLLNSTCLCLPFSSLALSLSLSLLHFDLYLSDPQTSISLCWTSVKTHLKDGKQQFCRRKRKELTIIILGRVVERQREGDDGRHQ